VEFTGALKQHAAGAQRDVLGVDACAIQRPAGLYGRRNSASARRQVVIVTHPNEISGTGRHRVSANNVLDAPNFFDQGDAPPFRRNQFGVHGVLCEK